MVVVVVVCSIANPRTLPKAVQMLYTIEKAVTYLVTRTVRHYQKDSLLLIRVPYLYNEIANFVLSLFYICLRRFRGHELGSEPKYT